MPLFSLSSLCRAHRACTLISNGAKHKQTVAAACMRARFIPICQRKQTWDRTTCWSEHCPDPRCCQWVRAGFTPDRAEIGHLCMRAFVPNNLPSVLTEQRAGINDIKITHCILSGVHTTVNIFLFCLPDRAGHDYAYLQGAEILWRSFCVFPLKFPKHAAALCISVCHQDWDAKDSFGYT